MSEERELPVMRAAEPIAKCEVCGHRLYRTTTRCQAAEHGFAGQPENCALEGEDWLKLRYAMQMQNVWST
jgi:hypothetical protein